MTARDQRWCVLGGGMLGQVLALRLRTAGHDVTILEAAPETGGLAATWEIGGVTWDKHYHVILPGDRLTLGLLDELGLADSVDWRVSRTGFFAKGRMSSLNGAVDYLRLPVLGLIAKVRLAATLMFAARIRNGDPLDDVPVGRWLTKWSGRAAYEHLWRPLLRAKLGDNENLASARFIWASIRRLYLARSAGAKTETLGVVRGGYKPILDALSAKLAEAGVTLKTDRPVSRVTRQGDMFRVEAGGTIQSFDRVVSTLACTPTAKVCDGLSVDLKNRLDSVVYQGILCASLVLKRPLGGYYLTYLTDDDLPFTAVVEMSALTGTDPFAGNTLVYLPRYVTQDDAFWQMSDTDIETRFRAGLSGIYPDLNPGDIQEFRLSRVRNVMAVPTLGYSKIVPPVRTNVEGLYIVNSAQITDGTLNVDATLSVLDAALPELLEGPQSVPMRTAA